jgi:hypothetical protein
MTRIQLPRTMACLHILGVQLDGFASISHGTAMLFHFNMCSSTIGKVHSRVGVAFYCLCVEVDGILIVRVCSAPQYQWKRALGTEAIIYHTQVKSCRGRCIIVLRLLALANSVAGQGSDARHDSSRLHVILMSTQILLNLTTALE